MKTCTKCGSENPLTEFYKHPGTHDGLQSRCKACIKGYAAKWAIANPEKMKTASSKYRTANPDKMKARAAKWNTANPEKHSAFVAKWKAANPEACRINGHNRRARERANCGKLSPGLTERLYKLQRGKCACCGEKLGDNFHLDHRMPLALSGQNVDSNMQLLRAICNMQKHAKHPIDFMQSRGFLL